MAATDGGTGMPEELAARKEPEATDGNEAGTEPEAGTAGTRARVEPGPETIVAGALMGQVTRSPTARAGADPGGTQGAGVEPVAGNGAGTGGERGLSTRASDRERDAVVQRVQDAFAEGRLDDAEFDERTRAALTARTHADLDALLADLPAETAAAGRCPRWPGPVRAGSRSR